MISHKHKFIFIHIPKAAGSSITNALRIPVDGHHPLSKILKNNIHSIYENRRNCDKYFKFCFVRNPWDRAVSAFEYMRKGGEGRNNKDDYRDFKKYFSNPQSFQEFIKSDTFNEVLRGNQQHFTPMTYYIDGSVDFIGKFENLQEDFDTICDKIGIPKQKLPHRNKTKHKHYTEYYDEETKQIVAEKYAKDIEYFGYDKV